MKISNRSYKFSKFSNITFQNGLDNILEKYYENQDIILTNSNKNIIIYNSIAGKSVLFEEEVFGTTSITLLKNAAVDYKNYVTNIDTTLPDIKSLFEGATFIGTNGGTSINEIKLFEDTTTVASIKTNNVSCSNKSVNIGYIIRDTSIGSNSINIGDVFGGGINGQGNNCIAIGLKAGQQNQGINSIGVGFGACAIDAGSNNIAIGSVCALNTTKASNCIFVGINGCRNYKNNSIHIGETTEYDDNNSITAKLGTDNISIGYFSGRNINTRCISIGSYNFTDLQQDPDSIRIGSYYIDTATQCPYSICIGYSKDAQLELGSRLYSFCKTNNIYIGNNITSDNLNSPTNALVLNSADNSGPEFTPISQNTPYGFFINCDIKSRNIGLPSSSNDYLFYDPETYEIFYSTNL